MSHFEAGPLAAYSSLQDKHLSGYFGNTRMRRHLVKSGLITRNGYILSENAYRLKIAKKEHRKQVRDLLATAIVHKALDMERMRQHEIRKKLEELYKIQLVQKVRAERDRKGDEELIAILSPRVAKKQKKRRKQKEVLDENSALKLPDINLADRAARVQNFVEGTSFNVAESESPNGNDDANTRTYAPHPPAGRKTRKHKVHRGLMLAKSDHAVAHRVQLQSMAEVTMKFLGSPLNLSNSLFPSSKLSEVQVLQQHCGGSTLCVFREMLPPNTVFTFVSRRHRGSPFGLTINIDSLCNIRISSCCEYKHKPGNRIGGKNSQFALIGVQGAAPCYRCQVRMNLLGGREKPDQEVEQLSDDEQDAAMSFDIIVSRCGPREAPAGRQSESADVTTQTADAEKYKEADRTDRVSEESMPAVKYANDEFEAEAGSEETSMDEGSVSSSDSTGTDYEEDIDNKQQRGSETDTESYSSSDSEQDVDLSENIGETQDQEGVSLKSDGVEKEAETAESDADVGKEGSEGQHSEDDGSGSEYSDRNVKSPAEANGIGKEVDERSSDSEDSRSRSEASSDSSSTNDDQESDSEDLGHADHGMTHTLPDRAEQVSSEKVESEKSEMPSLMGASEKDLEESHVEGAVPYRHTKRDSDSSLHNKERDDDKESMQSSMFNEKPLENSSLSDSSSSSSSSDSDSDGESDSGEKENAHNDMTYEISVEADSVNDVNEEKDETMAKVAIATSETVLTEDVLDGAATKVTASSRLPFENASSEDLETDVFTDKEPLSEEPIVNEVFEPVNAEPDALHTEPVSVRKLSGVALSEDGRSSSSSKRVSFKEEVRVEVYEKVDVEVPATWGGKSDGESSEDDDDRSVQAARDDAIGVNRLEGMVLTDLGDDAESDNTNSEMEDSAGIDVVGERNLVDE